MSDEINSQTPSEPWADELKRLRPNMPSGLQRRVFYQAGYEAAKAELAHSQRRTIALAAASVLLTVVSSTAVAWSVANTTPAKRLAFTRVDSNLKEVSRPPANGSSSDDDVATQPIIANLGNDEEETGVLIQRVENKVKDFYGAITRLNTGSASTDRREIHGVQIGPIGSDWDRLVFVQRPTPSQSSDVFSSPEHNDNWGLPELRRDGRSLRRRLWGNTNWPTSL